MQYVGSLRHARQASSYDAGPFSELSLAATLPVQQVVASYKACDPLPPRYLNPSPTPTVPEPIPYLYGS